jgi:hypothetical protein
VGVRPLLAILNPREIPEFEESIQALPIATVRLRGYTEREIADGVWEYVLDQATAKGFTHLSLISDDLVVPARSLDLILEHAFANPDRVTTGWANVDEHHHDAGITYQPLTDPEPTATSYRFPTWRDVLMGPEIQETFFTGFVATTCTVEMWRRYPYELYGEGWAADYSMSRRLHADGVRIDCLRDAFCLHMKENRGAPNTRPERKLLIGKMRREVRFDA